MTVTLTALELSSQPVNQPLNQAAIIEAALRAMYAVYGPSSPWDDFADAIKGNREAKELLEEILWTAWTGSKREARRQAFGIGMVAGLLFAASTGITLAVPQIAELKAAVEASERKAQAYMAAAAQTGATPGASEVA